MECVQRRRCRAPVVKPMVGRKLMNVCPLSTLAGAVLATRSVRMSGSIYKSVRQKLISHGADRSPDGIITIKNKLVFLGFVQLERAVRIADFTAVQSAVKTISERVSSLGKQHLIVFAYMYLSFSDGTPKMTHSDVKIEGGGILRSVEYRRAVTPEERLIADWGHLRYNQLGRRMLGAVYASSHPTSALMKA
jgi:hypothetical protein